MKDPGFVPERGWTQEYPHGMGDDSGFDTLVGDLIDEDDETGERNILTPRSVWLHRAITDRLRWEREDLKRQHAALPTRTDAGAGPGAAVRGIDNPSVPVGVPSPAGTTLPL